MDVMRRYTQAFFDRTLRSTTGVPTPPSSTGPAELAVRPRLGPPAPGPSSVRFLSSALPTTLQAVRVDGSSLVAFE